MSDFEALYRQSADPWQVRTSWYEQRKRAVLLACLPRARYGRILELGCGNGEMTRHLAVRCDALVAVDSSATAISLCEQTLARDGLRNTSTHVARLPEAWPVDAGQRFDLIVVSELAYYIAEADLPSFLARCAAMLGEHGEWAMCHYSKDLEGRPQPTAALHGRVDELGGLSKAVRHEDERFMIDVWRRADPAGPAA
ncbi:Methyltransferase domain-containing protein [Bordetella sputigena]|uniref:class I SAM-dependent DNA methyltransferase n=1 Tax=Bordetella sputigena TaxID=1416810 RepID=UPI0039EF5EC4